MKKSGNRSMLLRVADAADSLRRGFAAQFAPTNFTGSDTASLVGQTKEQSLTHVSRSMTPVSTSQTKEMATPRHRVSASERADFIDCMLDWVIEKGRTGEYDRDGLEDVARQFCDFARTEHLSPDVLFKGLKAAGVKSCKVDLPPHDPRYLEAKRRGIVRPRAQLYWLPDEIPGSD